MENARKLAILMDFENLAIGIENNDPEGKRMVEIRDILEFFTKNYGKVFYRKAFADWANPKIKKYVHELMRCGFEMQQIARMGNNKNNAESYLIIEAMDIIARNSFIDTIVLVTGDAAFLPLISYIRSTGRMVIGIGPEGAIANSLVHNCDEYLAIGQEGIHDIQAAVADRGRIIRTIRNLIGSDSIPLDTLEKEFAEAMPDFNAEDFGIETLEDFLEDLPNLFHIDYSMETPLVSCCANPRGMHSASYSSSYGKGGSNYRNASADTMDRPLADYLKDTRMYISDGPTREDVLVNIYNLLASPDAQENAPTVDEMRENVTRGLDVDDQDWRGTIYSLSSGQCIFDYDGNSPLPKNRHHIAINHGIANIEEFILKYYSSLFHKAFNERSDITVDNMIALMHPEDPVRYEEFFQRVLESLKKQQK